MSTVAELMAAGRRLDTAREQLNALADVHADRAAERDAARVKIESAVAEYRRILEDITGQHADVIQRRLSI